MDLCLLQYNYHFFYSFDLCYPFDPCYLSDLFDLFDFSKVYHDHYHDRDSDNLFHIHYLYACVPSLQDSDVAHIHEVDLTDCVCVYFCDVFCAYARSNRLSESDLSFSYLDCADLGCAMVYLVPIIQFT